MDALLAGMPIKLPEDETTQGPVPVLTDKQEEFLAKHREKVNANLRKKKPNG